MIVPKITYKFFFNRFTYKYDILRTKNMIYFLQNHNFIQIHLLVSIKIKIIMTLSRPNVYKYMVLYDFHSPSMKEERLREKTKLYPLFNQLILSYPAKFLLLNSLSDFFFYCFVLLDSLSAEIYSYNSRSIHYQTKLFVYKIIFFR